MNYSYTVTRVDQGAKCMEVEFIAEGFDPVVVGVRLPRLGENTNLVIQSFAPFAIWNPPVIEYADVATGTSGSYVAPSSEENQQELENARMWAQLDFEKQVAAVLIKFGVLQSDPTDLPVAIL
jgi:hypothetical protein